MKFDYDDLFRKMRELGYTTQGQTHEILELFEAALSLPRFPVELRKMWSGTEVQAWIDEHRGMQPEPAAPTKEWCMNMARLEVGHDVDAGLAAAPTVVGPVAWLRADRMKAMPAEDKAAWIEAGNPELVADYTIPLYEAPQEPPHV